MFKFVIYPKAMEMWSEGVPCSKLNTFYIGIPRINGNVL